MTENLIQFEGGNVLASAEPLTVTGLLLPFNEVGRTNLGRLQVAAGAVTLPTDPSIVGVNTDHIPQDVVGRAVTLTEKPEGVFASIKFADTIEGRAAYADAIDPKGKRRKLSAEFGPAVIKAGKLVAGHAKLWGAALVEAGAFPSAMVLAADTPDAAPADAPATDPAHVAVQVATLPDDITATTPAGDSAVYTPEAAPAEANPEGESTVTASATAGAQAPATVPATQILASAPVATSLETNDRVDKRQVFAAIAEYMSTHSEDARQVLAALTDVKVSGAGSLPVGGAAIQPNWVGQINQGVPYVREYITLGKLGTDISVEGKKGFKVKRGTTGAPLDKFDGTWAGNKAAVNSYNGFTQSVTSSRRNFAIAEDITREFYDLPGGAPVIEAFLNLITEDYYRQTDDWALADWVAAAGAPVAAATAKYPTNYPAALGMLIQGILAVKKRKADGRRDVPTFAIANELAFEELAYAAGGEQNLPAFVSIAISTASDGKVDGNVQIVQGETGIKDTSSAIVGADYAIEFDELPGGPLTLDALAIANGGIDKAVHGYLQTFKAREEAVVLIGTADAP